MARNIEPPAGASSNQFLQYTVDWKEITSTWFARQCFTRGDKRSPQKHSIRPATPCCTILIRATARASDDTSIARTRAVGSAAATDTARQPEPVPTSTTVARLVPLCTDGPSRPPTKRFLVEESTQQASHEIPARKIPVCRAHTEAVHDWHAARPALARAPISAAVTWRSGLTRCMSGDSSRTNSSNQEASNAGCSMPAFFKSLSALIQQCSDGVNGSGGDSKPLCRSSRLHRGQMLVVRSQRLHDLFQIAGQHLIQLMHRQADAMVGHPILRKVVRANFFAAVAGSNLSLSGFARFPRPVFPVRPRQFGLAKSAWLWSGFSAVTVHPDN